jgi:hypothetical protein
MDQKVARQQKKENGEKNGDGKHLVYFPREADGSKSEVVNLINTL